MNIQHKSITANAGGNWYAPDDCSLDEFVAMLEQQTLPADVPHAADIVSRIPLYDCSALRQQVTDSRQRKSVMAEWARILLHGAGVLVLRAAFADTAPVDRATEAFNAIIERERGGKSGADHFAAAGANDRVWNALQKLCEADPLVFADYYANDMLDLVHRAWLGPNYQVTSQVNVVRPGGQAQSAHRDYHLGFQTAESAAEYPAHVHALSPVLTLQGAVAHCDMPVDSGPTKLLPFSQAFGPGYLAYHRADFKACFEERHVQLPLNKGDAMFFNPALFHAAGENRTKDIARMANLLQTSSAFGIAMESMDRPGMSRLLLPVLQAALKTGRLSRAGVANVAACSAYGYSFPTNLDTDPPVGGLAPKSQQKLLLEAVDGDWDGDRFAAELEMQEARRRC